MAKRDAIVLTGGNANIDPARYGAAEPGQASRDSVHAHRSAAMMSGKPVVSIFCGLQQINVAPGNTLRARPARRHR